MMRFLPLALAALWTGPTAHSAQVCEINMDWLNDPRWAPYQALGADRVQALKDSLRERGYVDGRGSEYGSVTMGKGNACELRFSLSIQKSNRRGDVTDSIAFTFTGNSQVCDDSVERARKVLQNLPTCQSFHAFFQRGRQHQRCDIRELGESSFQFNCRVIFKGFGVHRNSEVSDSLKKFGREQCALHGAQARFNQGVTEITGPRTGTGGIPDTNIEFPIIESADGHTSARVDCTKE